MSVCPLNFQFVQFLKSQAEGQELTPDALHDIRFAQ